MKIIILGSGPTHGTCPYNREVWGVNRAIRFPQFQVEGNKLFFLDDIATFNLQVMSIADLFNNRGDIEYITSAKNVEYLKKYNIPATKYPLDEIISKFKSSYFANSISYMVAYAMYIGMDYTLTADEVAQVKVEGRDIEEAQEAKRQAWLKAKPWVESIALYGIDHLNYREYMIARCGLEYWLGRAQQSGIDLEIAGGSAILNTINGKLYGYDFLYDKDTKPVEKFIV